MLPTIPWDSIRRVAEGNPPVTAVDVAQELPLGSMDTTPQQVQRFVDQAMAVIEGPNGIGVAFTPAAAYEASLEASWLPLVCGQGVQWPFAPISAPVLKYRDTDGIEQDLSVTASDHFIYSDQAPQPYSRRFLPVKLRVTVPATYDPDPELVAAVHDIVMHRLENPSRPQNVSASVQAILNKHRRGAIQ